MSEWISVKDRLPEPETSILTWDGNKVREDFYGLWLGFGYNTNEPVIFFKGFHITHWMPLPEAPK